MSLEAELTYYEYWTKKPFWTVAWATQMIADCKKFKKAWSEVDDYQDFIQSVRVPLAKELLYDDMKVLARKVTQEAHVDPVTGEWKKAELNIYESEVRPREFVKWVYDKGYGIPYEFKAFIGVVEAETVLNSKELDRVDKLVCQGIAKTIWLYESDMKIEKMIDHHAIQVYGSGMHHESMLRRWLSDVDFRENKTGPKKKK